MVIPDPAVLAETNARRLRSDLKRKLPYGAFVWANGNTSIPYTLLAPCPSCRQPVPVRASICYICKQAGYAVDPTTLYPLLAPEEASQAFVNDFVGETYEEFLERLSRLRSSRAQIKAKRREERLEWRRELELHRDHRREVRRDLRDAQRTETSRTQETINFVHRLRQVVATLSGGAVIVLGGTVANLLSESAKGVRGLEQDLEKCIFALILCILAGFVAYPPPEGR